jgi:hypothetical protein
LIRAKSNKPDNSARRVTLHELSLIKIASTMESNE